MADRREVLKGVLLTGAALLGVPGVIGLTAGGLAAGQDDAAKARPREGDLLVKVEDGALTPLGPSDITPGDAPTMAWALDPASKVVRNGSKFNQVVLVRIDAGSMAADTQALSAEGVVAYAATCTHSGCEVGEWLAAERVLHCACHSSKFDPADGARVVDGPAPRSLPALPLKLVDRVLTVAGSFTTRVGYEAG